MPGELEGKVVVVTGGNRGLGLALARGVGRAGARVAIWSRTASRNDEAVAALAADGIDAFGVACDTADEAAVEAATADTIARAGKIDVLFANAGIADTRPFVDTTLDEWHHVLRTNLDGTFLCTRAVARHLIERGEGGSIVVLSSTISRYGGARQIAYTTSKTGLVGLGRTLATELARYRIRVNVLIPGWTKTEMNTHLQEDERFVQATTARTPVRRWADAEEFERIAVFLADPTLTFHTGDEVVVDGGYTIY
jgi:NAD(P)-dependent dehydrogenase (short-subunit alcohol dehydrogenase family)